jgi:hypothetical protein
MRRVDTDGILPWRDQARELLSLKYLAVSSAIGESSLLISQAFSDIFILCIWFGGCEWIAVF